MFFFASLYKIECFFHNVSSTKVILPQWVAANGGCERGVVDRMNKGYRAWGVLKVF